MANYTIGYEINISADGDTVHEAFIKCKAEAVRIYGVLNELAGKDLTYSELNALKTGNIDGSRVTGTLAGYVEGSHVTGNIAASQVSGTLTNATIPNGKVTGLEAFVKSLIPSVSDTDTGEGLVTDSQLGSSGYVKFGNGLILQWGIAYPSINAAEYNVTFGKSFATECYVVIVSGSTAGVTVGRTLSTTGFTVSMAAAGTNGTKVSYIAIGR